MPLAAQRRHVIASLHHPFPAIVLYQHLLCPSVVLLVLRTFVQTRIATPRKSHPEATLRILALFVLGTNLFATFIHVLDLADGSRPGKSLLIDFVGLRTAPTPALVLGMDAFFTIYQMTTLYIGYLSYPVPSATSRGFPADPLLPPDQSWTANDLRRAPVKDVIFENEDDEESQLTSAGNYRQRESGHERSTSRDSAPRSGSARNDDRAEEDDNIYSEFDDLLQRTDPEGDVPRDSLHHIRIRHPDDPYTVVNIPLWHMLKTILTYPRPSSVSSVEPTASMGTLSTSNSSDPVTSTTRSEQPTVPLSTITDLQLQALTQLHPGLLNASAREAESPTEGEEEEEEDDGRAEYRRMPGGYTRPSTS